MKSSTKNLFFVMIVISMIILVTSKSESIEEVNRDPDQIKVLTYKEQLKEYKKKEEQKQKKKEEYERQLKEDREQQERILEQLSRQTELLEELVDYLKRDSNVHE